MLYVHFPNIDRKNILHFFLPTTDNVIEASESVARHMSSKGLFWIRMDENIENIGDESADLGERKNSLQTSKRKSRRFGIFKFSFM